MRSCGNINPTSVIACKQDLRKMFYSRLQMSTVNFKNSHHLMPMRGCLGYGDWFNRCTSLFPITIAPGIKFRITNTEVQQQKIRSQHISLIPADNLSFLEKEKQSCPVRASTRWFLLGEVLQGWMPGNLQTPSLSIINPLHLMGHCQAQG